MGSLIGQHYNSFYISFYPQVKQEHIHGPGKYISKASTPQGGQCHCPPALVLRHEPCNLFIQIYIIEPPYTHYTPYIIHYTAPIVTHWTVYVVANCLLDNTLAVLCVSGNLALCNHLQIQPWLCQGYYIVNSFLHTALVWMVT